MLIFFNNKLSTVTKYEQCSLTPFKASQSADIAKAMITAQLTIEHNTNARHCILTRKVMVVIIKEIETAKVVHCCITYVITRATTTHGTKIWCVSVEIIQVAEWQL